MNLETYNQLTDIASVLYVIDTDSFNEDEILAYQTISDRIHSMLSESEHALSPSCARVQAARKKLEELEAFYAELKSERELTDSELSPIAKAESRLCDWLLS